MIDHGRYSLFGVRVNAVDYAAVVEKIQQAAQERRPLAVTALAVHGLMTGVRDSEYRQSLNQLDLVVPDGQPVRWALNYFYRIALQDRVYGPVLMMRTCRMAAAEGIPVFFYGSRPVTLDALVAGIKERLPALTVAGMEPSVFRPLTPLEETELAERIRASGTAITFVGLGCPRQEVWAASFRERLSMPVIAVGAAFDFLSGQKSQAPAWMQRNGLEWLFRLWKEPWRLWRRYLILNPLFVFYCARKALAVKLRRN